VRLTAGVRPFRQAVVVRMDPRARTSTTDLTAQFKVAKALQDKRRQVAAVLVQVRQRPAVAASMTAGLSAAMARLTAALDAVLQSDLRPTPAADAAATTAIDLATSAIAAVN
jgi:hypothetical protein